jgi:hypothetical protein
MQLSVKHEMDKLEKSLNQVGRTVFKPALNASLNKTGTQQVNASVRTVSQVQRVQQKLIKKRLHVRRSNFRSLTYHATVNFRGITWHSLGANVIQGRGKNSKTKGVRAGSGKNRHIHAHAFIARSGKSGNEQVFVRDSDDRYPLRVLRVRLYQPFKIEFNKRIKKAKVEFLKTVDRELSFRAQRELSKIG